MPSQRKIIELRNKVLGLPALVKFELYEDLRADLISMMTAEDGEAQRIREGQEALEAMKKVAKELGLEDGDALTSEKFDSVSRRLELGWSSAKIIRLYGSWRLATGQYRGDRHSAPKISGGRLRRRRMRKIISDDEVFDGIRLWLKTKPETKTLKAYSAWATQHNAEISEGETPLLLQDGLRGHYLLRWNTILEIAEGKLSLEQAQETKQAENVLHKREDDLIGVIGVALLLEVGKGVIRNRRNNDNNFPIPVAYINKAPAWLMSDLRLYKRGLVTPDRVDGEAQADYMDAEELRPRLKIGNNSFLEWLKGKRWDKIPEPDGYLGIGYPYWKRPKAEKWLERHAEKS